jgi:hypothetical protein
MSDKPASHDSLAARDLVPIERNFSRNVLSGDRPLYRRLAGPWAGAHPLGCRPLLSPLQQISDGSILDPALVRTRRCFVITYIW